MAYVDAENTLSDQQAITADAASTNVIDFGSTGDRGQGRPINLLIQVTETFNNLTSLNVRLEADTVENFASATILAQESMVAADLVAGKRFSVQHVPQNAQRYFRLFYDVTGTAPTTGKITAALVVDQPLYVQ